MNDLASGTAELVVVNGEGYLWLGDTEGVLLGWIGEKQLDAIAKNGFTFVQQVAEMRSRQDSQAFGNGRRDN